MKFLCFVIVLALPLVASAKTTTVKTVDATGAPFPRVLIIAKSQEGGGEIARYLTDQDGRTPGIQFGSGLCRVIAMCPYGLCHTTIQEYLGSGMPAELVLPVSVNPTDLYGE